MLLREAFGRWTAPTIVLGLVALAGVGCQAEPQPASAAAGQGVARKQFRKKAEEIRPLARGFGACIASDKITVDGKPVGYMSREEADEPQDSGWQFFAGCESPEYLHESTNFGVYDVNTIANYDPDVIPLLASPIGSAFERDASGRFVRIR